MLQNAGNTELEEAKLQWDGIGKAYLQLKSEGYIDEIMEVAGLPGMEDMVFCANPVFPWQMDNSRKLVFISNMAYNSRKPETRYFKEYFESIGYESVTIPNKYRFEGMGDTIPHPENNMLFIGYGFRTDKEVHSLIEAKTEIDTISLELVQEEFYHLDTCFLPLNKETVLICESAFSQYSIDNIKSAFSTVIPIPFEECKNLLALNAHLLIHPDTGEKTALIQKGAIETVNTLKNFDIRTIELETGEFLKAGGSVFCMKMSYY